MNPAHHGNPYALQPHQAARLADAIVRLGLLHHARLTPADCRDALPHLEAWGTSHLVVLLTDDLANPAAYLLWASAPVKRLFPTQRQTPAEAARSLRTWLAFRSPHELTIDPATRVALRTAGPASA